MYYRKFKYQDYEINKQGKIRFIYSVEKITNNGRWLGECTIQSNYETLNRDFVEKMEHELSFRGGLKFTLDTDTMKIVIAKLLQTKQLTAAPAWYIAAITNDLVKSLNEKETLEIKPLQKLSARLSNKIIKYELKESNLSQKIARQRDGWLLRWNMRRRVQVHEKCNSYTAELAEVDKQINSIHAHYTQERQLNQRMIDNIPVFGKINLNDFISLNEWFFNSKNADLCGCYILRNNENGKIYVGQSKHIVIRQKQHWKFNNQSEVIACLNPHFKNDFDRSKLPLAERFSIKIVLCPKADLDTMERKLIAEYDSFNHGYNSTAGNYEK